MIEFIMSGVKVGVWLCAVGVGTLGSVIALILVSSALAKIVNAIQDHFVVRRKRH